MPTITPGGTQAPMRSSSLVNPVIVVQSSTPVPPEQQGNIAPPAFRNNADPYYLASQPTDLEVTDTLTIGNEIVLDGGVLTYDGVDLLLDGVPISGGGGGAVDSVTGTAGQITATPTTGAVVLSLPNVGTAGAVTNPASVTLDAQGRVTATTSYGYIPTSPAQVASAVTAGVAPYAPLAGATFTGPVDTTATELDVAEPTKNASAATKLYVDNAVAGITPGGAVNTVVAGSNIFVNSSNAANPIVSLAVTSAVNFNGNNLSGVNDLTAASLDCADINGVDTIDFGGVGAMTAVGALTVAAGGAMNMSSVGNTSIFATGVGELGGEVLIGGPVNHITIENDGVSITGVGNLSASSNVAGNNLIGATSVTAPVHNVGLASNFNSVTINEGLGYLVTNNSVAPVLNQAGLVDSHYNPIQASLAAKTLNIAAKNGAGSNVTMASVDLGTILGEYIPLAGTEVGAPVTGTVTFDETSASLVSKNITTALLTPIPTIGFISALGPLQVEGGNFLVANGTSTEIGLAATSSPPLDQVATIKYNFADDDLLHFNKVLEAPGAVLDGNDVVPLLTFKDARTFYVSKQGADTNSGAANAPFLTVQAAVTAALATGAEAVVDVGPGVYTENITINSVAGILIKGVLQNDRMIEGTTLKGVITVQVTGTDNLFNNQVVISGCAVFGIIRDTSSKQHTLIVDGCRIEGDAADGGEAIDVNMTSTDGRTFLRNCVMTQEAGSVGRNPVVQCNVGQLNIQSCEITARDDASAVIVNGSAFIVRMSQCTLASTSPSANPDALLQLTSTSASTHAIAQTLFQYTSTTSKTSPGVLAARSAAGVIAATLANCIFALGGTLAAGNVVQFVPGTTLILAVADNRSTNTALAPAASQIQSGITVLPLTRVGETVVSSLNGLSGALNVAAGTGISVAAAGSNITVSATNNGTLTGVAAGTAISVDNTNPAVPVVTNTGVTSLIAGSNISLSGSTGAITISAVGGGGGGSAVNSVSAGTGITLTGTAEDVIVNNAGVLSLTAQGGIENVGTAAEPIIQLASTGTVTFQDVNVTTLDVTGTGSNFSQFGVYPRVGGTYVPPTDSQELIVKAYVDEQSYGVQSVSAGDASIQIGGTPAAPTVSVAVSGVTAGAYTNTALTVGVDGRVTAAASGPAPVLSVSGTAAQIASTGGSTPVLSLVDTAVTPGSYTYTSLTVDSKGRLTAAASGAAPVLTTVNGNSGAVTLAAGDNVTIDNSVPGTITIAASGGGGGAVDSVSGTADQITVSPTTGNTVVGLAVFGAGEATYAYPASVAVDDYGRVISVTAGDQTTVNTLGGAITLAAGTNVTLDTAGSTITINASGGSGGVQTVSGSDSVEVDNTDAANPIVSLPVQGAITPGTYNQVQVNANGIITFAETVPVGVLTSVVAGSNISVDDTDPAAPIVSLNGISGNATAPIAMGLNELTSDTYIQGKDLFATTGFIGHWEGPFTGNKWAIPPQDADGPGENSLRVVKIDENREEIAGTSAVLYSERFNPLITTPFATAPSTVAAIGTTINNAGVDIVSGSIALNSQNWPTLQTGYYGILGNISLVTSSAQPLRFTIRGQITGKAATTFVANYVSEGLYHTVPLNNISFGFGANGQIAQGDTLTITVRCATIVSLATTTIATAVPVLPVVLSPLTMAV